MHRLATQAEEPRRIECARPLAGDRQAHQHERVLDRLRRKLARLDPVLGEKGRQQRDGDAEQHARRAIHELKGAHQVVHSPYRNLGLGRHPRELPVERRAEAEIKE